ncbi:hypothetical protein IFM89_007175 [Coptis chinensis]|uniref:Uncharacterized protein n=1 Tax=Coptis chinensis TaxID=261450 RepID=A0A835LKS1_9MAGN|nr:hypothetical protein IFM89_007175 [Coptis chinensis]
MSESASSRQSKGVDGIAEIPANIVEKGVSMWSEYVVGFFVEKRLPFPMVKVALARQWKLKAVTQYQLIVSYSTLSLTRMKTENRNLLLDLEAVAEKEGSKIAEIDARNRILLAPIEPLEAAHVKDNQAHVKISQEQTCEKTCASVSSVQVIETFHKGSKEKTATHSLPSVLLEKTFVFGALNSKENTNEREVNIDERGKSLDQTPTHVTPKRPKLSKPFPPRARWNQNPFQMGLIRETSPITSSLGSNFLENTNGNYSTAQSSFLSPPITQKQTINPNLFKPPSSAPPKFLVTPGMSDWWEITPIACPLDMGHTEEVVGSASRYAHLSPIVRRRLEIVDTPNDLLGSAEPPEKQMDLANAVAVGEKRDFEHLLLGHQASNSGKVGMTKPTIHFPFFNSYRLQNFLLKSVFKYVDYRLNALDNSGPSLPIIYTRLSQSRPGMNEQGRFRSPPRFQETIYLVENTSPCIPN